MFKQKIIQHGQYQAYAIQHETTLYTWVNIQNSSLTVEGYLPDLDTVDSSEGMRETDCFNTSGDNIKSLDELQGHAVGRMEYLTEAHEADWS